MNKHKKSLRCRLQWTVTFLPAATWKIWICACVFFGSQHLISSPNHFCSPVKALFEAESRQCFLVIAFSCHFLSQPLGAVLHRVVCVGISCRGGRHVLAVRQPDGASCKSPTSNTVCARVEASWWLAPCFHHFTAKWSSEIKIRGSSWSASAWKRLLLVWVPALRSSFLSFLSCAPCVQKHKIWETNGKWRSKERNVESLHRLRQVGI